uniref:Uncharacterized protein n=1 Tax=Arundo donax TaxID=35708 RepID=A0A0A9CQW1_ARUDO
MLPQVKEGGHLRSCAHTNSQLGKTYYSDFRYRARACEATQNTPYSMHGPILPRKMDQSSVQAI